MHTHTHARTHARKHARTQIPADGLCRSECARTAPPTGTRTHASPHSRNRAHAWTLARWWCPRLRALVCRACVHACAQFMNMPAYMAECRCSSSLHGIRVAKTYCCDPTHSWSPPAYLPYRLPPLPLNGHIHCTPMNKCQYRTRLCACIAQPSVGALVCMPSCMA